MTRLENILWATVFFLALAYAAVAFHYPVVELEGPFVFIFVPIVLTLVFIFAFISAKSSIPFLRCLRTGFSIGSILSLSLFLSNVLISEPYSGGYVVTKVSIGRGKSIHWEIRTKENAKVLLNINIDGVSASTPPEEVSLSLYRGWLNFYFGSGYWINSNKRP